MAKIEAELPEMIAPYKFGLSSSPLLASMAFDPQSAVPVAGMCLNDVCTILNEARVAIIEARAHIIWYREYSPSKPNERLAVWTGRFYVADVALRLYAAGEHLAAMIINMLQIDEQELKKYTLDRNTSIQSKVGRLMLDQRPGHHVSEAIRRLQDLPEWSETIAYRNNYNHNQPPTLKGLGMVYKRRKRWVKSKDSYILRFGLGDKPEYSIDDFLRIVKSAFFQLRETVVAVADCYREILAKAGITEQAGGG